ncbi:hypothetical protein SCUCBS95973_009363 [Sporothrix curviconia]|uniref:SET domain-containing protein n=1 Tax=Sporothrix curviconia TaxID=1260050 RepID=A0ABP0CX47_9PEZI
MASSLRPVLRSPRQLLLLVLLTVLPTTAVSSTGTCLWRHNAWPSPRAAVCHRPVDSTAGTDHLLQHTPWTHRPRCIQAGDLTACVYTEQGLSLVTTPDAASDAAAAAAAFSVEQEWSEQTSQPPLLFAVRGIPGKGKGAVATRNIARGALVLNERPLLLARLDLFGNGNGNDTSALLPHHHDLQQLLHDALAQLSPAEQDAIHDLAVFRQRGDATSSLVEDILRTNGLGVSVGGGVAHTGLYPRIARLNHACRPNTPTDSMFWRYSPRTLAVEFVALRDIAAGEELTLSYTQRDTVEATRHDLLTHWGFHCACSVCSSKTERQRLDDSMARLKAIEARLAGGDHLGQDLVRQHTDEMMALVDGDDALRGPRGAYSYHLVVAAQAAWAHGHGRLAREYTERALVAAIEYGGPDDEHVGVLRHVLKMM